MPHTKTPTQLDREIAAICNKLITNTETAHDLAALAHLQAMRRQSILSAGDSSTSLRRRLIARERVRTRS
jgi:hypothetical protein